MDLLDLGMFTGCSQSQYTGHTRGADRPLLTALVAEMCRCLEDDALAAGSSHAAPVKNHQPNQVPKKHRKAA